MRNENKHRLMSEIEPIQESVIHFSKVEQLEKYVEAGALPACTDLWNKNIQTIMSGGSGGQLFVQISLNTLSERNKAIAMALAGKTLDPNFRGSMGLKVVSVEAIPEEDLEKSQKALLDKVSVFLPQKLRYGFWKVDRFFKDMYGIGTDDEAFPKTDLEMVDFCNELGMYYDKESKMVFLSRELFDKYQASKGIED